MDDGVRKPGSHESKRRGVGRALSGRQWVLLLTMGGFLVAIGASLVLVVRSASVSAIDVLATAMAGPTPTETPLALVPDALPTPVGLYWPPQPQPLATPNAPGDLLWWDARFQYRQEIVLDDAALASPYGTWARVLFDGERATREGEMRADGADLRVVVWDGARWWEIPRRAQPRLEKRGWNVVFHLQGREVAQRGRYYVYYGNPRAELPPVAADAPTRPRLLLVLDVVQSVEWGPEVTWTAHSEVTQRIVSPDGRIVIECPPGGPQIDTRVRLRTVPLGERNRRGALPDYELHADPPPGPPDVSQVIRWQPPLVVTLNWAGLLVEQADLETWVHFAYDTATAQWYRVPVEFDAERGLIRIETDQP